MRKQSAGSFSTISLDGPQGSTFFGLHDNDVASHSRSELLTQASSVASLDNDKFVKLLLKENAKQNKEAVRRGLANAMNIEETPFDLSAAILVDFLDGALQFCQKHSFNSLKTSALLKLMNATRCHLIAADGNVTTVVPQFKEELLALTRIRRAYVHHVEVVEDTIREAVLVAEPVSNAKAKVKGKGKVVEERQPTTYVEKSVQREVVSYTPVDLAPVLTFDECAAIIDYVAVTLFQHSVLYAHVFSSPRLIDHQRLDLFVHDCFPPLPLSNARTDVDHQMWMDSTQFCTAEETARTSIAAEGQRLAEEMRAKHCRTVAEVRAAIAAREAADRRLGLSAAELGHAIESVAFNLQKEQQGLQKDESLFRRFQALEAAMASIEVADEAKGKRKAPA